MLPSRQVSQSLRDELLEAISAAARRAREDLELTQEDVGLRLGVSAEYYGRIERGHVLPSVPTLRRMASVLQTDIDVFLGMRRTGSSRSGHDVSTSYLEPASPQLERVAQRLRDTSPEVRQAVSKLLLALERLSRS